MIRGKIAETRSQNSAFAMCAHWLTRLDVHVYVCACVRWPPPLNRAWNGHYYGSSAFMIRSDRRTLGFIAGPKVFSTIAYWYLQCRDVSGGNNIGDELRHGIEKLSRIYVTPNSRSFLWNIDCVDKKKSKKCRGNSDFFYLHNRRIDI